VCIHHDDSQRDLEYVRLFWYGVTCVCYDMSMGFIIVKHNYRRGLFVGVVVVELVRIGG
jgi:hypothetical protein